MDQRREFFTATLNSDNRKKRWNAWIIGSSTGPIVWNRSQDIQTINSSINQHYIMQSDSIIGHSRLTKCKGCHLNANQNNNMEICNIPIHKATKVYESTLLNFNSTQKKNQEPILPIDAIILEENLRDKERSRLYNWPRLEFHSVEIPEQSINIIKDNVSSQEHIDQLIQEYQTNLKVAFSSWYQFYTDGSLASVNGSIKMGAAWIQTKGPNPYSTGSLGVADWPSSARSELTAIIAALLTVPAYNKVEILTDNANCISIYEKLKKPNPKRTLRRWMKNKNWFLWMRLTEILHKKYLVLELKKVKAHSGNVFNETVDKLAKEGRDKEKII
jgi:ribonuclease HI